MRGTRSALYRTFLRPSALPTETLSNFPLISSLSLEHSFLLWSNSPSLKHATLLPECWSLPFMLSPSLEALTAISSYSLVFGPGFFAFDCSTNLHSLAACSMIWLLPPGHSSTRIRSPAALHVFMVPRRRETTKNKSGDHVSPFRDILTVLRTVQTVRVAMSTRLVLHHGCDGLKPIQGTPTARFHRRNPSQARRNVRLRANSPRDITGVLFDGS